VFPHPISYTDLKAALVERPFGFCRRRQDAGRMAVRNLWIAFTAVINADFSPRGNAASDQLAPDGRLPGMAVPTLDILGEVRLPHPTA
jgi:hypothetical protein